MLSDTNSGWCDSSAEGLISLHQVQCSLRVLADSSRSRDCKADYIHNRTWQVLLHPSTVWHQFGTRDISEDYEWDHIWHQGHHLLLQQHTLSWFSNNRKAHSPPEPGQEETSRHRSTVKQWQVWILQEWNSFLGTCHQQGWCEAWPVKGWSYHPNTIADGREWAETVPRNGELPGPSPAQPVFSAESPEPTTGDGNRMAAGSSTCRSVHQRQDIVDYSTDFGLLWPHQANHSKCRC